MNGILFWNVDTQFDFMDATGALPVTDAKIIRPNLQMITELATQRGIKVVNTADWHHNNSAEFAEEPDYTNSFPAHCLAYSQGAQFIAETAPFHSYRIGWQLEGRTKTQLDSIDRRNIESYRNITILKDAFDVFEGNKAAEEIVDFINPTKVFVYGVATDVCVNHAVQGLLSQGRDVYFIEDAMKGIDSQNSRAAQQQWEQRGAHRVSTQTIENYLR